MDNNEYQIAALATLNSDSGTFEKHIHADTMQAASKDFVRAADQLEALKKQLFYGKNLTNEQPVATPLAPKNMKVLHGKIGIAGEAGEIWNAETKEDVCNEVGDILWYIAVLLDAHGLTFTDAMQGNIDKLSKRYTTGKFTTAEAIMGEHR